MRSTRTPKQVVTFNTKTSATVSRNLRKSEKYWMFILVLNRQPEAPRFRQLVTLQSKANESLFLPKVSILLCSNKLQLRDRKAH
jgi:hypothetical protein